MSFQDVGRHNSNRKVASAGLRQQNSRPTASIPENSSWGTAGSTSSVGQISEYLTQYQVRTLGYLYCFGNSHLHHVTNITYLFFFAMISAMLAFWKRLRSNFWQPPATDPLDPNSSNDQLRGP